MIRPVVWFSCGVVSAVAGKLAVEKYGDACIIVYCNTFKYEHPDNKRFFSDVEQWLDTEILVLSSDKYTDIYDVFDKTGYLVGPKGARCTTELKRKVRQRFSQPGDIDIIGYSYEESVVINQRGMTRVESFEHGNPEVNTEWILVENKISKQDCHNIIKQAGIDIPEMYRLGYKNNNCIGCVKGGMGYWSKIREDFPWHFQKMAKQERKMGRAICKSYAGDKTRKKVYLDELPHVLGLFDKEPDFSCGPMCVMPN